MIYYRFLIYIYLLFLVNHCDLIAQDNREFKIFQFPSNMVPTIDGKKDDWNIVPVDYSIGINQMRMFDPWDSGRHLAINPKNLDVKVKVGWVKGLNRLYFLYEAYDNYWDFSLPGLHNDIFEVVVDGDQSGGPFITPINPNKKVNRMDAFFSFQGVHAQNYHIYTPAKGKEWAYVWGTQQWIKKLPYANAVYNYRFNPGESGNLILEFWITPFDYAGAEGPSRAVESLLTENKSIGLSWATIDYDNVNEKHYNGFWALSEELDMYENASHLLSFRLMPLENRFLKPIDAQWSFVVSDMNRRMVCFIDESKGIIKSWKWSFGDGQTSIKQNPIHFYSKAGYYTVILWVEGPLGKSRMAKMWEVVVK
jgi:hypothetical protein